MEIFIGIISIIVIIIIINSISTKNRRERLQNKYNDSVLVERLMNKEVWMGQTEEQLIDSIGKPRDIDQKVLKTKTKEIWKYNETGKNRYAFKVTIENGEVVGWDKK
jgi:uncharacterized membrane protein